VPTCCDPDVEVDAVEAVEVVAAGDGPNGLRSGTLNAGLRFVAIMPPSFSDRLGSSAGADRLVDNRSSSRDGWVGACGCSSTPR
jgi:hypothetical protein